MTPGWTADPPLLDLAVRLTRLMFPYLLLVGLAALATGMLNAHRRFFTAALGPAVLNVGMIASVLLLARRLPAAHRGPRGGRARGRPRPAPRAAAGGPAARRAAPPSGEWRHPAVATIARRLAPAAFGLAAVQITVVVNTLLASLLPRGSISFLYYADRVMEFPLGVFGIALATAVAARPCPRRPRGATGAGLTDTLGFALRLSVFVAVPAAAGLVALGGPIVSLLFQRGQFGAAAAAATTQALAGYAVGLPAFSATRIVAQTFYAIGDTRTPVLVGLRRRWPPTSCSRSALMWPLAHAGLALASSLSAYVNLLAAPLDAAAAPGAHRRAARSAGPRADARRHRRRSGSSGARWAPSAARSGPRRRSDAVARRRSAAASPSWSAAALLRAPSSARCSGCCGPLLAGVARRAACLALGRGDRVRYAPAVRSMLVWWRSVAPPPSPRPPPEPR